MSDRTLIGLQALFVALSTALMLLSGRFLGLWVPALGLFLISYLGLMRRARAGPRVDREQVRRLSRRAGLTHSLLATLVYASACLSWPEVFDLSTGALPLIAPTLGLGAGSAAFVLTLCGADLGASRAGIRL